jgi:serine/threonine protein kinase
MAQVIPPSISLTRTLKTQSKYHSESTISRTTKANLLFERGAVKLETYEEEKEKAGKALLKAVGIGNLADTEALLQGTFPGFVSAPVSIRSPQGETLLHTISRSGNVQICQLLLDYGIMPEGAAPNSQGQTPLHLSSHFGHFGIVRLLVKAGADLSATDSEGNTPLHCAALARRYDVTKFLRLSGADAGIRNKQGRTAIDCQSMKTLTDLRKTLHVPSIRTVILPSRKSEPLKAATQQTTDYELLGMLGEGSFGEVYLVREIHSGQKFALKSMKKGRVLEQKMTKYAFTERNVLCRVQSPFIVGLHSAFQNTDSLFLLLDYCPGGDLSYYLAQERRFSEHKARLYISELVLALEELHKNHIIYRDLKPSNIVLTAEGHIKLTDFGLAKEGVRDNNAARSFCGSMGYLAPEMLKKQGHGKAADWYMLGTLLYELLTGSIPFFSRDYNTFLRNMETGSLSFPMSLSSVTKDFLSAVLPKQLLCKDPSLRLGSSGDAEDIKAHPFFSSVSWQQVLNKELKPPKPSNPDLFARPLKQPDLHLNSASEAAARIPGWEFSRELSLSFVKTESD